MTGIVALYCCKTKAMKGLQPEMELDDVIFEHRNKAYGAYFIRKMYEANVGRGLFVSILVMLFGISIPIVANYLNKKFLIASTNDISVTIGPLDKPKFDEEIKPKLPEPEMKELEKRIAFRVPEITDNKNDTGSMVTQVEINSTTNYSGTLDTQLNINVESTRNDPIDYGENDNTIYMQAGVEEKPEFPGGEEARLDFFAKNLVYPELASQYGIEGIVMVGIVVEKDGSITNIRLLKGIGAGCDDESLRVVKLMPKWVPGKQNGHPARVQINLPVRFVIIR
jgi:periplasmic protein TonB